MTIDTTKLRELAQNATPGPWTQWEGHGWVMAGTPEANEKGYMAGTYGQVCRTDCDDFSDAQGIKNAEYIAAANPATVLALLDKIDGLESMLLAACADLGAINAALDLDPDDGGAEPILYEVKRLLEIEKAARNLAKVKGRHHSEQAMNRLIEACT